MGSLWNGCLQELCILYTKVWCRCSHPLYSGSGHRTAYKPGLDGSYGEKGLWLPEAFPFILDLLLYSWAPEKTINFI